MPQGPTADLILVDSDFLMAEQILDTYLDNLCAAAQCYEDLCAKAVTYAITESEICAGLTALQADMTAIRGRLAQLRESLAGQCQAFVQEVDQIDQFVY